MRLTLKRGLRWRGVGLHTGRPAEVRLAPAPPGTGWRLNGGAVSVERVVGATRATTLETPRGPVLTVEHLFAALYAQGVDDAEIAVRGGEVPALGGSAAAWGTLPLVAHPGERAPLSLEAPVEVRADGAWIRLEPAPRLSLVVEVSFPGLAPSRFETTDPTECLDARTFGYLRDVPAMRRAGLAGGANLDNAIALDDAGRPLNPGGLRHPDELARHKALDLLGDLALLGRPLRARVTAHRAGHALHHALVRALISTGAAATT